MLKFKIESVSRHSSELVEVKVTMSAASWGIAKATNGLGSLYDVDISNEAYRNYGVKAHNPIVSDTVRAKNGIKLLTLTYADSTWIDSVEMTERTKWENAARNTGRLPEVSTESDESLVDNVIYVDFIARKRCA